jgi:uncharacterized membrane protein
MWVSAGASTGLFLFSAASGRYTSPQVTADSWAILAMGVATAGAFVCLLGALQRIGAVRTSIVSATEPFSAALLAFVFLDESVGMGTALGGLLILAGAVAASVARAKREQQIPKGRSVRSRAGAEVTRRPAAGVAELWRHGSVHLKRARRVLRSPAGPEGACDSSARSAASAGSA